MKCHALVVLNSSYFHGLVSHTKALTANVNGSKQMSRTRNPQQIPPLMLAAVQQIGVLVKQLCLYGD